MLRLPVMSGAPGSLKGMRIGIIRESMLLFPGVKADEPIVEAADKEIKEILGKKLGATLVESVDPDWKPEPGMEQMNPSYSQALAQIVPVIYPELLYRLTPDGKPLFPEFAAAIIPTEFAPGKTFRNGHHEVHRLYGGPHQRARADPQKSQHPRDPARSGIDELPLHVDELRCNAAPQTGRRVDTRRPLRTGRTLNARSKFWGDDQRAAF